jgi:hypothetical protein
MLGTFDRLEVGLWDGLIALFDGLEEGPLDGDEVGVMLGSFDGLEEGPLDGDNVGEVDGEGVTPKF